MPSCQALAKGQVVPTTTTWMDCRVSPSLSDSLAHHAHPGPHVLKLKITAFDLDRYLCGTAASEATRSTCALAS
eukprot:2381085-Prorocentrum_lima.AAC.1